MRCAFWEQGLTLVGEAEGRLHLPLAQIAKLRLGRRQTPFGPDYEARVWRAGAPEPLVLRPLGAGDHAAYAHVMRAVAWALAREHGTHRVEAGLTKGEALFGPLMMVPAAAALTWVALFVAEDIAWPLRLLIPLPAILLCALLISRANRRQYPRTIRSAAHLDQQLPQGRT